MLRVLFLIAVVRGHNAAPEEAWQSVQPAQQYGIGVPSSAWSPVPVVDERFATSAILHSLLDLDSDGCVGEGEIYALAKQHNGTVGLLSHLLRTLQPHDLEPTAAPKENALSPSALSRAVLATDDRTFLLQEGSRILKPQIFMDDPNRNGSKCTWALSAHNAFCTGSWDEDQKQLPNGSVEECQALALDDMDCGDTIYANGVLCRCVRDGAVCALQPSSESAFDLRFDVHVCLLPDSFSIEEEDPEKTPNPEHVPATTDASADPLIDGRARYRNETRPTTLTLHSWDPSDDFTDLFVPCSPSYCAEHYWRTPPSLWDDLENEGMRFVYVFRSEDMADLLSLLRSSGERPHSAPLEEVVVAMALDNVTEAHPPVQKEMRMLKHFAEASETIPGLFVKLDTDAVISPSRIARFLETVDAGDSRVYLGRPLSSCGCEPGLDHSNCDYASAINLCSGFFYVTTRATLRSAPPEAFVGAPNGTRPCDSSDMSVGYLMKQSLGLHCAGVRSPPDAADAMYPGVTYPLKPDSGFGMSRMTYRNSICQQAGSPGGIVDAHTISVPVGLFETHPLPCMVYHPAKEAHDVLFAWNTLREARDVIDERDLEWETRTCPVAIYVPSSPPDVLERQAVRLTWASTARAYGMRVLFTVGHMPDRLNPSWVDLATRREAQTHRDILFTNTEETYVNLPLKMTAALRHYTTYSPCDDLAFVDQDTFVRPYQFLKAIEIAKKSNTMKRLYGGHIWWDSKAVKDPNNPWYLRTFKGITYPPFASGYAKVLTGPLAQAVMPCMAELIPGPDDVQLGLCVEGIVHKGMAKVVPLRGFSYNDKCSDWTAADNSVCEAENWNLFQRHEAHINNKYCDVAVRKFVGGARAHHFGYKAFEPKAVAKDLKTKYLLPALAPWESTNGPKSEFFFRDLHGTDTSYMKKIWKGLFETLGARNGYDPEYEHVRLKNSKARVWKCISCTEAWYQQRFGYGGGSTTSKTQSFQIKDRYEGVRGVPHFTNSDLTPLDIGVIHGCTPKLEGFLKRLFVALPELKKSNPGSSRVLVTRYGCDSKIDFRQFHRNRIDLVNMPGEFERASGLNGIHHRTRKNAILYVLDVDMAITPEAVANARVFAREGVSAYFPIVLSQYNPKMTRIVGSFYGWEPKKGVQHYPFDAEYRPWGSGMYALHGSDAKKILMSERFKGWGGEDVDFMSRVKRRLHVIRSWDDGIVHRWHTKDCDQNNFNPNGFDVLGRHEDRKKVVKSCVSSVGLYEGHNLAWYLLMQGSKLPTTHSNNFLREHSSSSAFLRGHANTPAKPAWPSASALSSSSPTRFVAPAAPQVPVSVADAATPGTWETVATAVQSLRNLNQNSQQVLSAQSGSFSPEAFAPQASLKGEVVVAACRAHSDCDGGRYCDNNEECFSSRSDCPTFNDSIDGVCPPG